ncbi:MAG: dTDP-4-dehydrorhamnose reductase, partial [Dehalococcoidia bacterium]
MGSVLKVTRVAVIGSTGQLGTDLVQVMNEAKAYQAFPLGHAEVESTDPGSVQRALREVRPDIVVNCAAFVRVDDCEDESEEAFRVNALGALYVARACVEQNALCVYIGTDYVFNGEKGGSYTESDLPNPINVYGASKLAGEHLVRETCPRWLIVRVASLFGKAGARGKGGNFVETVLHKARAHEPLQVVDDITMSPTYTLDAVRALEQLLSQEGTGLFHLANRGSCTWYEFARKALELAGVEARMDPIAASDYRARARRPKNSSLRSDRLGGLVTGGLRSWEEALKAYLAEKG